MTATSSETATGGGSGLDERPGVPTPSPPLGGLGATPPAVKRAPDVPVSKLRLALRLTRAFVSLVLPLKWFSAADLVLQKLFGAHGRTVTSVLAGGGSSTSCLG